MRKLVIIALLAITTIANAQDHLQFKGVEIDGSYNTFVSFLEFHGCQTGTNKYGRFLIRADFAGIEMYVYPQTTSQTGTVYAVVSGTSMIKEWVSLNAQYDELKNLLTQKYGKGKSTSIPDGYHRNSANVLERGNVYKPLIFESANGKIYLYIHKSEYQSIEAGSINIQYIDKANEQLRLQEANTDI